MDNTSSGANETMIFDLYSSMAAIIGFSIAYGILGSLALVGEYPIYVMSNFFNI